MIAHRLLEQKGLIIHGEVLGRFMRGKRRPLPAVSGRIDEHLEKGGSHEYPTHATVQPTKVPG